MRWFFRRRTRTQSASGFFEWLSRTVLDTLEDESFESLRLEYAQGGQIVVSVAEAGSMRRIKDACPHCVMVRGIVRLGTLFSLPDQRRDSLIHCYERELRRGVQIGLRCERPRSTGNPAHDGLVMLAGGWNCTVVPTDIPPVTRLACEKHCWRS